MTEDPGNMSCAEFQAQMAELIGSGANVVDHEHLKECSRCCALLADLETIADAARQLFPSVDPSDKLWTQIESAIRNDAAEDPAEELRHGLKAGLTPQPE